MSTNENRPIDYQYIDRAGDLSSHRRGDLRVIGIGRLEAASPLPGTAA